jgi:DNA replication protein DnaC
MIHPSPEQRAKFAAELREATGITDAKPIDGEALKAELQGMFAGMRPKTTDEMRAHHFRGVIAPRLKDFGFDERYHRLDLLKGGDARCRLQESVLASVKKLCVNTGAIVAMVGPRGTGKTSIAAQLAADRLWEDWQIALAGERKGVPCRVTSYRKLGTLVARLKAHYGDFGSIQADQMAASLEHLCSVECLVIDETHEVQDDSKHKDRLLTDILDRRYSARRDTVLISNQQKAEFMKGLSPSIVSRLIEHGGTIACEWQSFRDKPAIL